MKGKTPKREIHGILLLDKPKGMSSNAALQRVKYLYQAKKAGHTGSLDPLATGLLPICFGEATKLCQYLLEADKTYIVTARLGIRTTTSDAEGEVVSERPVPVLTRKEIEVALQAYQGPVEQIPSMYSALKYQGQPLYKLARQGLTIERPARSIHIYENVLLNLEADSITLRVVCSKGTYIRTLIDDLGEDLGCGAHVVSLRRTSLGGFQEEDMLSLDQLSALSVSTALDQHLFPLSSALPHWPTASLDPDLARTFCQGKSIFMACSPEQGLLKLTDEEGNLIGLGEAQGGGRVSPKRLIQVGCVYH